jgi:hypothetical protein
MPPHWPQRDCVAPLLVAAAEVERDVAVAALLVGMFVKDSRREVVEVVFTIESEVDVLDNLVVVSDLVVVLRPMLLAVFVVDAPPSDTVTLNTAISCTPRLVETPVPEPVWPLYISVHAYVVPAAKPGTSAKFAESVAAPLAATRPITTPSLSGPAQ